MFSKAQEIGVDEEKIRRSDDSNDYDTLYKFSVSGASHDSVEVSVRPRSEVYGPIASAITSWCTSFRSAENILWLYGPPESGKTAIAYTIAEYFRGRKKLAGSFFFCSSDSKRNNPRSFVATLSYQMTQAIPFMKCYVVQAINRDPAIFSKSIEIQAETLIFRPLKKCKRWFPFSGWPKIMVIDGLDECYDIDAQVSVLRILQAATREKVPLLVLLSSQVKPHIRDAFDNTDLLLVSRRIGLDDFQKDREDIRSFFRHGFAEILRKHRQLGTMVGIPKAWPPAHVVEKLVFASWGHPIYATTVLKFVDSCESLPSEQLDLTLSIRNSGDCTPLAELDLLYKQVLSTAVDIERAMEVLRALFVLKERKSTSELEILLAIGPGEVDLLLLDLRSVLNLHRPDEAEPGYITFHHTSFPEFLLDHSRSGEFFVDIGRGHAELTRHSIRLMDANLQNCRFFALGYSALDRCLYYAVRYWQDHLLSSTAQIKLLDIVEKWDISQWGNAILCSRVMSLEPLMRINEALSPLQTKDCPKERWEAFSQYITSSVDKVFMTFLDERRDIAPTAVALVTVNIPKVHPDYVLKDVTKTYRGVFWFDTLVHLVEFQYFRNFVMDPARSGQYFCGAESHSRAFMTLLNYVRSPVLYGIHSLEDDEAFYYALTTATFHLKYAAPIEELIRYLEDVLTKLHLFSDNWLMEDSYRPNFRKSITRYLEHKAGRPTV